MDYPKIFSLLNFTLSGTFALITVIYRMSGLSRLKVDFSKDRGLLPFVWLTVFYLFLGLFFLYNDPFAKYLQIHKELLVLLTILGALMAGLYLFKFKDAFSVYYSIIEIAYSGTAFATTFLLKFEFIRNETLQILMPLLWTLIGFLYVTVRGLENINKTIDKQRNPWLFPYWMLFKTYWLTSSK